MKMLKNHWINKLELLLKVFLLKDKLKKFLLMSSFWNQYLSLEKFSDQINDVINKDNADEVKFNTGFSIGGVSPFAHINKPKGIFIDKQLERYKTVYAAAGHPHVVLE